MGFMTRKNRVRKAAVIAASRSAVKETVAVEETVEEKPAVEEPTMTREQVMSMPFFKVKSVAQANGIDVADKKTAELRTEVIEKLGL